MKILSLKFQNLNSIRDEVSIDFESGPLGNAGLFAITGPTGAGKSTILDAISLALYGDTARNQRDGIISRGERKASSEVEFELRGKRYRSVWNMRISKPRKESSAPKATPSMELSLLDEITGVGEILADQITGQRSVRDKITELSGLDFSRFLQSMLLAQGQFDAFLVAKVGERSDLLEQITGTQIYSEISRYVYQRHKELSTSLNQRKEFLEKLAAPEPEQILAWNEEVSRLSNLIEGSTKEMHDLGQQKDAYARLEAIRQQEEMLARKEEAFIARTLEREADLALRHRYDKAVHLLPALSMLEGKRKEIELLFGQLVPAEISINSLIEKTPSLENAELDAISAEKEKVQVYQEAKLIESKVGAFQEVLAKAEIKNKQLLEQQNSNREEVLRHEKLMEKTTALHRSLTASLADIELGLSQQPIPDILTDQLQLLAPIQEKWEQESNDFKRIDKTHQEAITNHESLSISLKELEKKRPAGFGEAQSPQHALDELEESRSKQAALLGWIKEFGLSLKSYLEEHETLEAQNQAFAKTQQELVLKELQASQLADTLNETSQAFAKTSEEVVALKEAYEAIKLASTLREAHLHEFEEGEACPLCGALHHPAREFHEPVDIEKHALRLKQGEKGLQDLQVGKDTQEKELIRLQESIKAQSTRLKDLNTSDLSARLADRRAKLVTALEKASRQVPQDFDESLRAKLLEEYQSTQAKLTATEARKNVLLSQRTAHEIYSKKYEELVTLLRASNQNLEQLKQQKAEQQHVLTSAAQALSKTLENTSSVGEKEPKVGLVQEMRKQLEAIQQQTVKASELKAEVKATDLRLENTATQLEAARISLSKNLEEVSKIEEEIVGFRKNISSHLGEFASVEQMLSTAKTQADKAAVNASDQKKQLRNHQDTLKAKQLQVQDWKQRIEVLTAEVAQQETTLKSKFEQEGFISESELKSANLQPQELQALDARILAERSLKTELEVQKENLAKDRKQFLALVKDASTSAEVESRYQRLVKEQEKRHQQVGSLRTTLKAAAEQQATFEQEQKAIAQALDEVHDWSTLNNLIGSASGSRFRQYAQSITLQQLLAFANDYLHEFYPRFSVSGTADGKGDSLDIFICDHYEADQIRDVATVSGGERFLVSLALALGFSRMASNKITIDTLFIDEGFGTLDAETLDKAINALERLQQTGKSIGIISHVASLQERIGTQIRLKRQSGGRSIVEVIA